MGNETTYFFFGGGGRRYESHERADRTGQDRTGQDRTGQDSLSNHFWNCFQNLFYHIYGHASMTGFVWSLEDYLSRIHGFPSHATSICIAELLSSSARLSLHGVE